MKLNQIKGVMTELVDSKNRKSSFEVFLSTEDISLESFLGNSEVDLQRKTINKILTDAKQQYARIIRENSDLFNLMAGIETTIIQARCSLATETKLTMVNQKRGGSETSYVVARAFFYNPENVKAEIRVYLGKAEELGSDLAKLSNNKKFMADAEKQLVNAMIDVMEKSQVYSSIKKRLTLNTGEDKSKKNPIIMKKRQSILEGYSWEDVGHKSDKKKNIVSKTKKQ